MAQDQGSAELSLGRDKAGIARHQEQVLAYLADNPGSSPKTLRLHLGFPPESEREGGHEPTENIYFRLKVLPPLVKDGLIERLGAYASGATYVLTDLGKERVAPKKAEPVQVPVEAEVEVAAVPEGKPEEDAPGRPSFTIETLQAIARERGGQLLSKSFSGWPAQKYLWECGTGHSWWATLASVNRNIVRGEWCPDCAAAKAAKMTPPRVEDPVHPALVTVKEPVVKPAGHPSLAGAKGMDHRRSLLLNFLEPRSNGASPDEILKHTGLPAKLDGFRLLLLPWLLERGIVGVDGPAENPTRIFMTPAGRTWWVTGVEPPVESPVTAAEGIAYTYFVRDLEAKGARCLNPGAKSVAHTYKIQCQLRHQFLATMADIQGGKWCPTCDEITEADLQLTLSKRGLSLAPAAATLAPSDLGPQASRRSVAPVPAPAQGPKQSQLQIQIEGLVKNRAELPKIERPKPKAVSSKPMKKPGPQCPPPPPGDVVGRIVDEIQANQTAMQYEVWKHLKDVHPKAERPSALRERLGIQSGSTGKLKQVSDHFRRTILDPLGRLGCVICVGKGRVAAYKAGPVKFPVKKKSPWRPSPAPVRPAVPAPPAAPVVALVPVASIPAPAKVEEIKEAHDGPLPARETWVKWRSAQSVADEEALQRKVLAFLATKPEGSKPSEIHPAVGFPAVAGLDTVSVPGCGTGVSVWFYTKVLQPLVRQGLVRHQKYEGMPYLITEKGQESLLANAPVRVKLDHLRDMAHAKASGEKD